MHKVGDSLTICDTIAVFDHPRYKRGRLQGDRTQGRYIHNNPVEAGFVTEARYWQYSSAVDYSGGKDLIAIEHL